MASIDRLLPIKLAAPRPSHRPVSRPRMSALLGGALQARLVLLSAPPGFGKTTALLDWLADAPAGGSWLTLDETDNDPVRFLRYLRAAVARLVADDDAAEAVTAGALAASPGADAADVAEELATLLAEAPDPSVLVLDDYHLISSPEVQRAVGRLLERLPAQAHLVIATRVDPSLPLARLRARGELLEIRTGDLGFTADETASFFAQRMGLELSSHDVGTLAARTEGWPAVLQLAALSLARREDVSGGVRDFAATHRFVLDYVVEEVLAGLSPDTQGFLLRTSILDRLSGPLCDAVTAEPGCQERLEDLDRANMLIVPLDDERRWYRYHALFAEILRARLAALCPDEVPGLHARASAWHEARGDDDEAIAHALRSGDADRMSRVVSFAAGRHINAGEISTVRRWLDAVPDDVVRGHAQLSAAYAWCQVIVGEAEGAAQRLDDAERAFASGGDGGPRMRPGLPSQFAMLRSQLAGVAGDSATAVAQARRALELVPVGLPPEDEVLMRATASVLLALALLRAGDMAAAAQAYEASLPDLRAAGNVLALSYGIADLAGIAIARGDPAGALRLCEAELARVGEGTSAAAAPAVWAATARARAELGQPHAAEAAARRCLELAVPVGDAASIRSAQTTLARITPLLERTVAADTADAGGAGRGAVTAGLVEPLTPRELEVLGLVALGRSNSQVAAALFVTVGTVKSHLHTISGKLGAANRTEAVARARELGLVR